MGGCLVFYFTQFECACTQVCTHINITASANKSSPTLPRRHRTRIGNRHFIFGGVGVRGKKKSCHTERYRTTLPPPPRADCRVTSQATRTALSMNIYLDVKSFIGVEKHQILGCCVTSNQWQQKHPPPASLPVASLFHNRSLMSF